MKLALLAILVLFASGLSAQTAEGQTVEKPTISQDDLKAVSAEVKAEIRRAEQLADDRAEDARQEAEDREKTAIEKNMAAQEKLRNEIATANAIAEQHSEARQKKVLYSVGGVAMLVISAIVLARRSGKSVEVLVDQIHQLKPEIPVDPNKAQLQEFSERNGGINPVPFVLTLKEEGIRLNCHAKLMGDTDPLVYFAGESRGIPWIERRKHAGSKVLV